MTTPQHDNVRENIIAEVTHIADTIDVNKERLTSATYLELMNSLGKVSNGIVQFDAFDPSRSSSKRSWWLRWSPFNSFYIPS